jgi:hypothetical protein
VPAVVGAEQPLFCGLGWVVVPLLGGDCSIKKTVKIVAAMKVVFVI